MACSSRVATPMLIGILHPVIVLPQLAYVRNGMEKELTNILRHELTHYRRNDVLYKWLAIAVTSLHWFNPLMLLIRKEISRACELSCDEAVISGMSAAEKQSYGNTLLALSANRKLSAGVFATTLCEDKKELKERLISIMKYKKRSTWAVALTLVLALLLAGCGTTLGVANTTELPDSAATSTNIPNTSAVIEPLTLALKLPDDQLVNKYCSSIDLVLGDDLLFDQAKDIPSQTLFLFFCYITDSYGPNYQERWFDKSDQKFHVPVADLQEVLNQYFDGINLVPHQIGGYQEKANEVVMDTLNGFGGGRFPKLVKKEVINHNTLILTVDYYNDSYTKINYTKTYTIRFTDDGYRYLSIKKEL